MVRGIPYSMLPSRRRLLEFLLASPLLALGRRAWGDDLLDAVIDAPERALSVLDFEAAARRALPPAHFGYLATGTDDDGTLRRNREGFERYELRMRRLVDVGRIDTAVTLFGKTWPTPIVLAPASSQRAFHAEGELATARAARAKPHLMMLSTVATTSVEQVTAALGAPVWYQLYTTDDASVARALVKRAESAGSPALVLTVDLQAGSNRETQERFARRDARPCSACHGDPDVFTDYARRKPMFDGLDLSRVTALEMPRMTWDFILRLRDLTSMKLVVKGIVTGEDAALAVERGVDGIIVSNHGGRAEASGRSAIESLPEVVAAVKGRLPVLVDGGVRRGTDVFKALALGASAVGIARPYLWGLAAFGQRGVESVLEILTRELSMVMGQAGTTSVGAISRAHVADRARF
jgi:isopentenyl diphosphate isomerase/L-lactate dehydrogenase-like FMN-dependent dehydrogenase